MSTLQTAARPDGQCEYRRVQGLAEAIPICPHCLSGAGATGIATAHDGTQISSRVEGSISVKSLNIETSKV